MAYAHTFPRRTVVGGSATEAADPTLHRARIAFFFLLVFTALLYGRPADIVWSLQVIPMAEIAAVMAIAGYAIARLQGSAPFVWTTEVKIVLALTVIYIAGVPFAFWRTNTVDELTNTWFKTLIIFFLITQVVATTDRVRKILWVIILCEFFLASYALIWTGRNVMDSSGRMKGGNVGMLSGNYLGIAAATTMPYMAALIVRSKSFLKSMVLLGTFAMVAWMVVLTASRGSLLAMIFALLLVWGTMLRDNAKARMLGVVFTVALVVSLFFAPATFWARIGTLWESESYASSDSRSANESEFQRKALLQRSITWTLENPILGLGLGNFAIKSGSSTGGAQEWKGTHNTFTQVSSEAGIPAFILFISLLVISVRSMRRIAKACAKIPGQEDLAMLARATQVAVLAFMFSGMFAHLAYEFHLFYLAGISVSLQSAYARMLKKQAESGEPAAAAPAKINGRFANRLRSAAS